MRIPWLPDLLVVAVAALLIASGCRRPVSTASKTSSPETRQASADSDRKEELQFQDEHGNTDWRGRVEAAKEALEKAKSDKRCGKRESALEHALDAARLMPPTGKDFDLPQLKTGAAMGTASAASQAGGSDESANGNPGGGSSAGGDVQSADATADSGSGSNRGDAAAGETSSGASKQSSRDEGVGSLPGREDGFQSNDGLADQELAAQEEPADPVTNDEVNELRALLEGLLESLDGRVGVSGELRLDRDIIEIE